MELPLIGEERRRCALDRGNPTSMGVKPYGCMMTLAMTLNCMIGTGCFGLPFAFATSGLGLTTALLVLGTIASFVTMNYTLEAMARAEGVLSVSKDKALSPTHRLTFRRTHFSTIGDIFAGRIGYNFVQTSLFLYSFGCLWSFASIFASSVASIFFTYVLGDNSCDAYATIVSSDCNQAYYVCILLFSILVLSLVLMDIGDQAHIQQFLTVYRIVALLLMVTTTSFKLHVDGGWDSIDRRLQGREHWAMDMRYFALAFGSTILALNCHHNMPDLMQPLSSKKHARSVAFAAMSIGCIFYFLLGILGALAFDKVNPLVSLNWSDFTGCGNGWDVCQDGTRASWFGFAIHIIIIMFPVVNVVSVYPIAGVTLGGNLLTALPKSITAPMGLDGANRTARLLAVVPPLILAAIFKNLDSIFTVTGLFGFIIGLVVPCWFQVIGIRFCKKHFCLHETPYTIPIISSLECATLFLGFMLLATAIAIVSVF